MKIAVVTPYFPFRDEPYRGHSAYQTLLRMPKEAEIEVFCPVATYPNFEWLQPRSYRYRRADASYQPPDVKATYFEYPVFPGITRPFNGFICAKYLEPYLRAYRPDVILNYWVYPEGFGAVRAGQKLKIPVIVGCIGSDICRISDSLTQYWTLKTLRNAAHVIAVSRDLRKRVLEMGVEGAKATAILNGCDSTIFHPRDRAGARRQAGLDPHGELILFVGWLSPTKGIEELLDAFIALSGSRPGLRLALIGEGAYRADIEKKIADAGMVDRVLLPGRMPSAQVAVWIAACDVFCLPSYSEGCPNAVVEALASGRPVVATNVGGIPELVDERCGLLVPPQNSAKLAEALKVALDRTWDAAAISRLLGRDWQAAAQETYAVCRRTAESWLEC
jgi:glycosyltransferase involved in cell wall biosynthesis